MQSKLTLAFFGLCALVVVAKAESDPSPKGKCSVSGEILQDKTDGKPADSWKDVTNVWKEGNDKNSNCTKAFEEHLAAEFQASLSYLALSAFFQSEKHFLPGLAKFFLDSAAEERSHAKQMMEYVLMRGGDIRSRGWMKPVVEINEDGELAFLNDHQEPTSRGVVMSALKKALELEQSVTNRINKIIKTCQNSDDSTIKGDLIDDHHAIDYLTGEFLTEQHESTRQLAGMIASMSRLSNNMEDTPGLAETLFDQTLA